MKKSRSLTTRELFCDLDAEVVGAAETKVRSKYTLFEFFFIFISFSVNKFSKKSAILTI